MNNKTHNEVKKNVATGASTAAGATVGVVIGTAVTPNSAEAAEVEVSNETPQPTPTPQPQPEPIKPEPQPAPQTDSKPEKPIAPKPTPVEPEPKPVNPDPDPEVEVVSYDRVTNDDGSQMDVAVLNVNGNEVGVIDANLDGEADALVRDANQNGVIEDGEVENVQGQGISMQPFQDAAGFDPQFAQNDLPDYVNDADVDTYMA